MLVPICQYCLRNKGNTPPATVVRGKNHKLNVFWTVADLLVKPAQLLLVGCWFLLANISGTSNKLLVPFPSLFRALEMSPLSEIVLTEYYVMHLTKRPSHQFSIKVKSGAIYDSSSTTTSTPASPPPPPTSTIKTTHALCNHNHLMSWVAGAAWPAAWVNCSNQGIPRP